MEFVRRGLSNQTRKPILRDVLNVRPEKIRATAPLGDASVRTFSFFVDESDKYALDTSQIWINVLFRVVKADGTPLRAEVPAVPPLAPVEGDITPAFISVPALSLFSNCTVYYNDVVVYNSRDMFPWYAQFVHENLLPAEKRSWIREACFYVKDDTSLIPTTTAPAGGGAPVLTGYTAAAIPSYRGRQARLVASAEYEAMARLYYPAPHDYLLPGSVRIGIHLTLADPSLFLMSESLDTRYRVEVRDLFLDIKRVEVDRTKTPDVPRLLPYVDFELSTETVPAGTSIWKRALTSISVPKRLTFVLLDETAFQGRLNRAPFAYHNHGLESVQLELPPSVFLPPQPLKVDWTSNRGVNRLYRNFFENMGRSMADTDFTIAEFETLKNYYCFDLTVDTGAGSSHMSPTMGDKGLVLHLNFKTATTANIKVILFSKYEKLMSISSQKIEIKYASIHSGGV